uniref:Uncharacterized protein n=1 Tax=viral metagenome TaxID=1070528 RepID=A0A6C0ESL5_9ZZZZ
MEQGQTNFDMPNLTPSNSNQGPSQIQYQTQPNSNSLYTNYGQGQGPSNQNYSNRNYDSQLKIIQLKYKLLYQVDILKKHGVGVGLFVEYLDVLKNKYPSQNILNQLISNIDRNYSVFIYNLQDEGLIRDLLLFFPI